MWTTSTLLIIVVNYGTRIQQTNVSYPHTLGIVYGALARVSSVLEP